MRASVSAFRLVVLLATSAMLGCGEDRPSAEFPGHEGPTVLTTPAAGETIALELTHSFGADGQDEEELWFGRAHRLAVGEDGRVAITDPVNGCSVVVLQPTTGEFDRMGDCSDGPDGFRFPTEVEWLADTVVVWDERRGELAFIHPDEGVSRRLRLGSPLGIVTSAFGQMGAVSDSLLAVAHSLRGPTSGERFHLALVDTRTGEVRDHRIRSPAMADATPGVIATPRMCVHREEGEEVAHVVIANRWTPQMVVFRADGESLAERANVHVDVPGTRAERQPADDGEGWSPRSTPTVVCGPDGFLARWNWWRLIDPEDPESTRVHTRVRMDVISYSGEYLASIERTEPITDEALLLLPQAWDGRHLFALANLQFEHPLVRRFRLRIVDETAGQ